MVSHNTQSSLLKSKLIQLERQKEADKSIRQQQEKFLKSLRSKRIESIEEMTEAQVSSKIVKKVLTEKESKSRDMPAKLTRKKSPKAKKNNADLLHQQEEAQPA